MCRLLSFLIIVKIGEPASLGVNPVEHLESLVREVGRIDRVPKCKKDRNGDTYSQLRLVVVFNLRFSFDPFTVKDFRNF